MTTPANLPPALTVQQACDLLGIGLTTGRDLIRRGLWCSPVLRLGRQYRIPRDPLLEVLGISPLPLHDEGRPCPAAPSPCTDPVGSTRQVSA